MAALVTEAVALNARLRSMIAERKVGAMKQGGKTSIAQTGTEMSADLPTEDLKAGTCTEAGKEAVQQQPCYFPLNTVIVGPDMHSFTYRLLSQLAKWIWVSTTVMALCVV